MLHKIRMTAQEKRELEEYRATGLSPRQVKAIERDAAKWREYVDWLGEL